MRPARQHSIDANPKSQPLSVGIFLPETPVLVRITGLVSRAPLLQTLLFHPPADAPRRRPPLFVQQALPVVRQSDRSHQRAILLGRPRLAFRGVLVNLSTVALDLAHHRRNRFRAGQRRANLGHYRPFDLQRGQTLVALARRTEAAFRSGHVVVPYLFMALIHYPRRLIYLSSSMHKGKGESLPGMDWTGSTSTGSYLDSRLFVTTLAAAVARLWPARCTATPSIRAGRPIKMGGAGAPDDLRLRHLTQE